MSELHDRETRRGLIRAVLRVLIKGILVLLLLGAIVAIIATIGCQANADCSEQLGLRPQGADVSARAGTTWTVLTWMGYILGGALFLALLSIPLLIAGGAIGGGLYVLALGFAKWHEARAHAADRRSFHPIREYNTTPWPLRLLGFRWITFVDLDRLVTAVAQIRWTPWGKLSTTGSTADAERDEQMQMNKLNARVRKEAARASARSGKAAGKWEVLDDNDLLPYTLPKAGQQALGLGQDGPVQPALPPPTLPAPKPVDFARVAHLVNDDALLLGWSPGGAGKLRLATWLTYSRSALGILGGMRQGKTHLGLGLAAQMLKLGWQVVTLDPEKERSWKALAPYGAEWHQTDPDRIVGQLECVYAEWERRGELLDVYGVGDVQALAERVRPPHFALFLEELGVLRNRLSREDLVRFDHILSDLIQVGGKRLMRVVVVDHHYKSYTGEWPEMLRKQAIKLSFRQEQADKSLVGYYPLNTLGVGEFAYEGERWTSWQIAADLGRFLGGPQPPRFRPLIDDDPPLALPKGEPDAAEAPLPVVDADAETDLQTKAQRWIAQELLAGRTARQADLMRSLNVTKSYAHRLWNSYHPAGGNANWPYLGNPYLDATTDATWGELAGEPVQYDLSDEGERERFLSEVNWDNVQFPTGKGDAA